MTPDTVATPVPTQVRSRGQWLLPEEFALLSTPAPVGSARSRSSISDGWAPPAGKSLPVLPGQRRPVLETVLETVPVTVDPVPSITAPADRGVWVAPPPRTTGRPVVSPLITSLPATASARPTDAVAVAVADNVIAVEPAATAARVLPIKLLAERMQAVRWRRPAAAGAMAVLATLSAAAPTFGGDETKSLTVLVDGQPRKITTVADSVGEALDSVGISVREYDVLAPAPNAAVGDGSLISLQRGRPLTLRIDGAEQQVWTTADTLSGALSELGIDPTRYELSASRDRALGLDGLSVTGTSLRPVTLTVGTAPAKELATPAQTIGDLLAAQGVTLSATDTVTPGLETVIAGDEQIVVTRVKVETETVTEKIPQPKPVTVENPELGKGNSGVEKGQEGIREITVRRTTVNGRTSEKQIANSIVRKAKPDVTEVGTKETGSPESWSVPWDDMAFCESTSRWNVNTGNGTYGGLQFMTSTWLAYGGGEFAARADLASKEQQIIVAERLYAVEGLAPWHCARLLGWGFGKYQG